MRDKLKKLKQRSNNLIYSEIYMYKLNMEFHMSKGVVLLGDKTTHGGAVISASSTMIVNGKNVALIGDKISCPIIGHGINAIIEGSPEWSSDGCHCVCGCQVLSSAPDCVTG